MITFSGFDTLSRPRVKFSTIQSAQRSVFQVFYHLITKLWLSLYSIRLEIKYTIQATVVHRQFHFCHLHIYTQWDIGISKWMFIVVLWKFKIEFIDLSSSSYAIVYRAYSVFFFSNHKMCVCVRVWETCQNIHCKSPVIFFLSKFSITFAQCRVKASFAIE